MERAFLTSGRVGTLLPHSITAEIASCVGLSEGKQQQIRSHHFSFTPIHVASEDEISDMGKRLDAMNTYGTDDSVEGISPDEELLYYVHLLSPSYLRADGGILSLEGRDIAYACFYPVAAEYDALEQMRQDLIPYFQKCHQRANWGDVAAYLGRVLHTAEMDIRKLYHLYDYATPDASDRGKGYGRFVLRLASDLLLPEEAIRVGYIDPDHADSLLASCQSGSVLGRECPISPDGEHASFFSFYGRHLHKSFPGKVVMSAEEARHNLPEFVKALRETVGEERTLVAFNSNTHNYEHVTVTYEAKISL